MPPEIGGACLEEIRRGWQEGIVDPFLCHQGVTRYRNSTLLPFSFQDLSLTYSIAEDESELEMLLHLSSARRQVQITITDLCGSGGGSEPN